MPGNEHFEWINVKWLCFEVWTAFHEVKWCLAAVLCGVEPWQG